MSTCAASPVKTIRISIRQTCLAAWLFAGGWAFGHGDLHERIAGITLQIAAQPHNAGLHLQRAELCRQHADWPAALSDCDRAKQLDPSIDTDFLHGRILLESGNAKAALPVLERFLSRQPEHFQASLYRARALSKLNRAADAAAGFREALGRAPTLEPDLLCETAGALAAEGSAKQAVQVLEMGIEKLGHLPSLVLRLVELEIAGKDYDAALRRVEVMQKSAPRPEPWMARRASVLAQAGRIADSRAAWQALLDHLNALPFPARGSHAMIKIMEDSRRALAALDSANGTLKSELTTQAAPIPNAPPRE